MHRARRTHVYGLTLGQATGRIISRLSDDLHVLSNANRRPMINPSYEEAEFLVIRAHTRLGHGTYKAMGMAHIRQRNGLNGCGKDFCVFQNSRPEKW